MKTPLVAVRVLAIRSAGRDGNFEDLVYDIGAYNSTRYDRDLLWADGLFVSYPAGRAIANPRTP